MTLTQLKSLVAAYFKVDVTDLTRNGQDLFMLALNTVRLQAELNHDFEFTRKEVEVTVTGASGGSLDTAVLSGTATPAKVKQVLNISVKNSDNQKVPVEWTTKIESYERMRLDDPGLTARYLSDNDDSWEAGQPRFEVSNRAITVYPYSSETTEETLYVEAYVFTSDWTTLADYTVTHVSGSTTDTSKVTGDYTYVFELNGYPTYANYSNFITSRDYVSWLQRDFANDCWVIHYNQISDNGAQNILLPAWQSFTDAIVENYPEINTGVASTVAVTVATDSRTDTWLTYGHEFLLWGTIVHLNHLFKEFVYRQEGNLQPPEKLAAVALENFKSWDSVYFEQHRRHGR